MHRMHTQGKRRAGIAAVSAVLAILAIVALSIAGTGRAPASSSRGAARGRANGSPASSRGPAGRPAAAPRGATPGPASPQAQGGPQLARSGVIVNYPSPSFPRLPNPRADAFVVADADTGQVLAAENPHAWYLPASTIKILTAISLIPVLNPDATTTASAGAVSQEENDVGLAQGHQYRIADLFRGMLMISGNDAAVALAEATGSYNRGIALMNAEAHRLQAYDTVAVTPNGLDAPGMHVSAYDQALIARQALRMPAFLGYDTTRTAMFPVTIHHSIELINQDTLLDSYPGFVAGKNGWTTPAMATYTGMARRNGHTLIVTLLHSVPMTWPYTAPALLNWGFAAEGKVQPVGHLVNPLPAAAASWPPWHGAAAHPRAAAGAGSGAIVTAAAAVIGVLASLGFTLVTWRIAGTRGLSLSRSARRGA